MYFIYFGTFMDYKKLCAVLYFSHNRDINK